MDSRLLIGPGIPAPEPTTQAPCFVSSISPAVSIRLRVRLSASLLCFCFVLWGGSWGGGAGGLTAHVEHLRGSARSLMPFLRGIIHKNLRDNGGGMRARKRE